MCTNFQWWLLDVITTVWWYWLHLTRSILFWFGYSEPEWWSAGDRRRTFRTSCSTSDTYDHLCTDEFSENQTFDVQYMFYTSSREWRSSRNYSRSIQWSIPGLKMTSFCSICYCLILVSGFLAELAKSWPNRKNSCMSTCVTWGDVNQWFFCWLFWKNNKIGCIIGNHLDKQFLSKIFSRKLLFVLEKRNNFFRYK